MREERDGIKSELNQLKDELAARDGFIDNLKSQFGDKETAIANLKAELEETRNELVSRETQLQQALQSVSPPAVVASELDTPATETITENTVFEPEKTEPETETENTESPTVAPEPITIQTETLNTTISPENDPGESELLTASQLAKKVNEKLEEIRKENKKKGLDENHNLPKPLKDYSLRDWFKKGSTCTDEYRALKQEEYGFKFSHHDHKGSCYFTLL